MEAGLLNGWENRFLSTPHQCPFGFDGQDKLAGIRNPDLVNLSSLYPFFMPYHRLDFIVSCFIGRVGSVTFPTYAVIVI